MSNTLKFGNGEWYGKKDTILAYNDENSNFKPLPFSFDRASSATRVNKDGLIETVGSGEPRIDYKDDSKGALLLEPTRSNLFPYSEDFSQSNWLKTNSTITSGFISPNGDNNAYEVNMISSTANLYENIGVSAQTDYTLSFYAKKGTATDVSYRILNANNVSDIIPETSYYSQLSSDWVRIEVSFTIPVGCSTINVFLVRSSTNFGTVLIFGAQLEQGSYATSYIPTQGGVVTRVVDFAEQDLPNDNILIDNNSTIYFEVDTTDLINNTPNTGGFNFKNSGGTSKLNFNYGYGRIYSNYYTGSTSSIVSSAEIGRYKIAFPLTNGSYLYVNGVQKSTTSRDWSSISISEIEILFGHSIIDFKLYNTILSNSELQALTTI